MTTAYLAGTDTNDVEMSYLAEVTYGTPVTGSHFKKTRMNSESFAEQKNRTRPPEIRSDAQSAPAVTQDVNAKGGMQFGVSYGNSDDLIAGLLLGAWTAPVAIASVDGDIVFESSGNKITSATSGKFTSVAAGQWIRIVGCTDNPADFFAYVQTKVSALELDVTGVTLIDETPAGTDVSITGSMLRNGTTFTSFTFQKRLATALGFYYPGTFFTGGQINAARGQFFSGTLDALCKSQVKSASALGTGFDAAPTNRVMDTVGNFKTLLVDGSPTTSKIMTLNTTLTRTGAALAYALGDSAAAGVGSKGTLDVSGTLESFFGDYSEYDDYAAETARMLSYRVQDVAGNAYVITVPQVVLGQATITAGGPNQAVMAQFPWMADPDSTLGYTFQLDRFAHP